jgi:PAS domain S-box-containing protein
MPLADRGSGTITLPDNVALLDVIPDGLIVLDRAWCCRFVNQAVETLLGRRREDLLGRPVWEVLATPPRTGFAARLERAAATQREDVIEWASRDGKGAAVYVLPSAESVTLLLRRDAARRCTRRALDEGLEPRRLHAQKMEVVGRLAGGVAHDFNNLLTVILNYGAFVVAELPCESAARADMDELLKAANCAAELTRQLLALSRKQALEPRPIEVKGAILRIVGMLRRVLGEDIRIETEFAPTSCCVLADQGHLEQVLMNLALNARDAMPDGGTLHLRTAAVAIDAEGTRSRPGLVPGTYVSIVVEDTGVGIAPDVVGQIFEPFYTTKADGTGLGLATVCSIVKERGGYVDVESGPGRGTRFTVLFPTHGEVGSDAGTAGII